MIKKTKELQWKLEEWCNGKGLPPTLVPIVMENANELGKILCGELLEDMEHLVEELGCTMNNVRTDSEERYTVEMLSEAIDGSDRAIADYKKGWPE